MVFSAELPCIHMWTKNNPGLMLEKASNQAQGCCMKLHRGQILEGAQQRLKAQTHLSAQDAAAALAAASFLDQLTSSQVSLVPRGAASTAHVPQYEHALRHFLNPKHIIMNI